MATDKKKNDSMFLKYLHLIIFGLLIGIGFGLTAVVVWQNNGYDLGTIVPFAILFLLFCKYAFVSNYNIAYGLSVSVGFGSVLGLLQFGDSSTQPGPLKVALAVAAAFFTVYFTAKVLLYTFKQFLFKKKKE
ncbi:MAG: hypothetical protein Q8O88_06250 [bacterium]|nr:hypothetical protein [bacterium]